jgi:SAM-dependent methyltransferase
VVQQVAEYVDAIRNALITMADCVVDPTTHQHADVVETLNLTLERLVAYERTPAASPSVLAALNSRIEALEHYQSRQQFQPWFSKKNFEDRFRGSHAEIYDRYRDLVGIFHGLEPVVDIGCGRGEFLTLLREAGLEAVGVELDYDLVGQARRAELPVDHDDGLDWLSRALDESLGGIALIQVVEHMTHQGVLDLVLLARDKLQSGGKILIETPNPQSLYVFAHSFYLDPDHTTPVHPAYLTFLFQEAGFSGVQILWRSQPSADESLIVNDLPASDTVPASERSEGHRPPDNDQRKLTNTERLNQLLFAPQDYALIAIK